jgi:hypothetical protein
MSLYQIAIFADGAHSHAATLRATLQRNFADLGISSTMLSFLDAASVSTRDPKSPVVGVYFGLVSHPALPRRRSQVSFKTPQWYPSRSISSFFPSLISSQFFWCAGTTSRNRIGLRSRPNSMTSHRVFGLRASRITKVPCHRSLPRGKSFQTADSGNTFSGRE